MTTTTSYSGDEDRIRTLIDERVKAVHAKDLAGAMADHAPDVVMFDVITPLHYRGTATVRERTAAWFALYQSPIGYEVRDLRITTGEDVAFCHYLSRVSGTRTDGGTVAMWVRATVCFRKVDGTWMVVHEHDSVPFDPASGKASLDLTP